MKTCKQCGTQQPDENFRKYYGGREGSYSFCKTCESIMQRRKYLRKVVDKSPLQEEELAKIELLYKYRAEAGLAVPGAPTRVGLIVDEQLRKIRGEEDC